MCVVCAQEGTKQYIEAFLVQQDELRRQAAQAAVAEDRKIQGGVGWRGWLARLLLLLPPLGGRDNEEYGLQQGRAQHAMPFVFHHFRHRRRHCFPIVTLRVLDLKIAPAPFIFSFPPWVPSVSISQPFHLGHKMTVSICPPRITAKCAEYWQSVRERESAEAERQAIRKEVADRMYEKVKREMEDEMRRWAAWGWA